ncbi:hypothetical protein EIK77_008108 [Talaromyces pinophilus]|nr:hypothetical protein EIK77_008108 [Talaromyces pinophilus]PCH07637.1 Hypothetical protein PENO1_011170 [Penicillium occitanis (nom. inval.)]PCH09434.1 hypothetical protein PENOC_010000 [Penicillium occitanis (nom. inval.)]
MFPWQGEGKATSFLLATQQREQRQQQAQQQAQQQSPQQQQSARQDNGYGRWRLPAVMQGSAGSAQAVNDKISSSHTSSNGANGRESASTREDTLPRPESLSASISGDDDEDEDEDGDAEEQGDSDGEDIDFRSSTRNDATPAAAAATTNGTEKQTRQPGQRLGERMPPLGYPPQPSFRNNHARRLNTEEEIKLFELCIKHSSTFGERSKLCEWWKNIANEFIKNYGGPYSWHSVRRKVDLVTRQRIKYLADLKEGKIEADQATDPWKKVLDEWIPTWEKFEISEKRRIEVRDQRAAMRKRKEPPTAAAGAVAEGSNPSSPAPSSSTPAAKRKSTGATPSGSWQATPSRWTPAPSSYGPPPYGIPAGPMAPPPPSTPGMKMPDGYDTMFRTPAHPTTHPLYPYPPPQPYYTPPMAAPPAADNNLTSAVLETLTKLNKHLEKADGTSPIVAALTGSNNTNANDKTTTTENGTSSSSSSPHADAETQEPESSAIIPPSIFKKLKLELRAEFETELAKEVAKIREALTSKLDALEQTQEMIMEMLRQEPGREGSA